MDNYLKLYENFKRWIYSNPLGQADKTVEQYLFITKSLLNFLDAFKITHLNNINHNLFLKFIHVKPSTKPYSKSSVIQRIAALDIFFAWATENRYSGWDNNPVVYYKKMKVRPKQFDGNESQKTPTPEILTSQEQKIIMKRGQRGDFLSLRDRCIVLLTLATGLYAEEITSLQSDSIHLNKGYLVVHKNTLHQRKVSIDRSICDKACREWQAIRKISLKGPPQSTYFFNNRGSSLSTKTLYKIISGFLLRCGLQKKYMGPDLLRQTAIYNMVQKGMPIETIKIFTGIRTSAYIEKYKNCPGQNQID